MLSLVREYFEGLEEFMEMIFFVVDFLKEWVNKDVEYGYVDGEVLKCFFIVEWDSDG